MQRHDQRAKRIAEQALDPFGDVTREFAVPAPDDQRGDLWFQRTRFPTDVPSYLQLFDALFPTDTMIEAYCKTVEALGLRSSLRKQLNYAQILGKRESRLEEPPPLWLLSAGRPETLFERFHFRPTPGVEEGRTLGRNEGRESALREAIAVLCEVLGIPSRSSRRSVKPSCRIRACWS